MKYLAEPHIQDLLAKGVAALTPDGVSAAFYTYMERHYPLVRVTQDSIDWAKVPGAIRLAWLQASDEEVARFLATTTLGRYTRVAVRYTSDEPCLVCDLSFASRNLDVLYWSAEGARYVFGVATDESGEETYCFADFAELDLDDSHWLSGIKDPQYSTP